MIHGSGKRLAYLNSHPRHTEHSFGPLHPGAPRFALAISFQTGSGAIPIAERLATLLQASAPASDPPWRVFHKTLMTKVLEDHHLPVRMAKFLPEDANNTLDDVLDELFGLHPSSWVIVQQSIETILGLVRGGNVILVGWGANVITSKLPNVFHVRLVGSMEHRIARIQQREHLSRKQALAYIVHQDRGRERYVRRHFGQQLSDAQLYHVIINTDRFCENDVAGLIADTALASFRSTRMGSSLSAAA